MIGFPITIMQDTMTSLCKHLQ